MKKKNNTLSEAKKIALINRLEKCMSHLVEAGIALGNSGAGVTIQDAQRSLRATIEKIESI